MYIDGSVYPDLPEPPDDLPTDYDKADYMHQICTAYDFHILPEPETFERFAQWKEIPLSAGYHAFRSHFGWEPVPMPRGLTGPEPYHVHLDRLEGRSPDPCEHLV